MTLYQNNFVSHHYHNGLHDRSLTHSVGVATPTQLARETLVDVRADIGHLRSYCRDRESRDPEKHLPRS